MHARLNAFNGLGFCAQRRPQRSCNQARYHNSDKALETGGSIGHDGHVTLVLSVDRVLDAVHNQREAGCSEPCRKSNDKRVDAQPNPASGPGVEPGFPLVRLSTCRGFRGRLFRIGVASLFQCPAPSLRCR